MYPERLEKEKEKESLFVPIPQGYINTTGVCFSPIVQACCILYDRLLTEEMNKACKILKKKFKSSTFEYLTKYSPYSVYILDDACKDSEHSWAWGEEYKRSIFDQDLTLDEAIENWKKENKEISELYEKDKKLVFNMLFPQMFIKTKEGYTDRSIYNTFSCYWEFFGAIRDNQELFGENMREVKDKLINVYNCIRKLYENPIIVKIQERD